MTAVLSDRSFNLNLVMALILAIVVTVFGAMSVSAAVDGRASYLTTQEMTLVQGSGRLGTSLLVVGLAVAVLGAAAVVTGGAVIVALAAANVTTGATVAAAVVNVGLYATGGGLSGAAIGATINWLDGR
jgi:hypothetical protein